MTSNMPALELKILAFFALVTLSLSSHSQYRPGKCLEGDKHRELPCPQSEGADYQACYQWSDSTCCTAEFSIQLAQATVENIDGFHWSRCDPPLSKRCEEYLKRIECFYRCSPNVAHWAIDDPSAFKDLPVCGQFCDDWFDACASDLTCATNWITDWVYINDTNYCKNKTCRNFRDIYGNGTGLCKTLWSDSFVYTDQSSSDTDRQCLSLWWPLNETNPNDVAIRNIFQDEVDTVIPAPCQSNLGCHSVAYWSTISLLVVVAKIASNVD